jgi:hypothetical protein
MALGTLSLASEPLHHRIREASVTITAAPGYEVGGVFGFTADELRRMRNKGDVNFSSAPCPLPGSYC